MGKSLCVSVDDSYPALRANHKSEKKHPKSRVGMKNGKMLKLNAELKVKVKLDRIQYDKKITKSRSTKRRLKRMECGIKTPMEEGDACNEADCVDFTIGMEKYERMYMM